MAALGPTKSAGSIVLDIKAQGEPAPTGGTPTAAASESKKKEKPEVIDGEVKVNDYARPEFKYSPWTQISALCKKNGVLVVGCSGWLLPRISHATIALTFCISGFIVDSRHRFSRCLRVAAVVILLLPLRTTGAIPLHVCVFTFLNTFTAPHDPHFLLTDPIPTFASRLLSLCCNVAMIMTLFCRLVISLSSLSYPLTSTLLSSSFPPHRRVNGRPTSARSPSLSSSWCYCSFCNSLWTLSFLTWT